jgi:hypothetical protein
MVDDPRRCGLRSRPFHSESVLVVSRRGTIVDISSHPSDGWQRLVRMRAVTLSAVGPYGVDVHGTSMASSGQV